MPSFPLDRSEWIPVAWLDGGERPVSLIEAIQRAPEIARIVGNPLEVAVLTRLLLAIAHLVRTPEDAYEWLEVWEAPQTLLDGMAQHVRDHTGAFDLYGDKQPFAQHPGLPLPSASPATLVYDRAQGNNPVFLDASQVAHPKPVTSAEAARALLVAHAFAGSGTGGLNPLNGGKKDTMYAGPLCARMVAFLEGESLAKTLVLNLASEEKAGRPAWERPLADGPGQTRAEGVADLYTRPTRLARLRPSEDGRHCLAASLFMGQALPADETDRTDPTMPRRLVDKQIKTLRLAPDKAAWRSAHLLLSAKERDGIDPLRALGQLQPLLSKKMFSRGEPIRLRILGVAANAQGPVTEMWRDETLRFDLSVVAADERYNALRGAVEVAEKAAWRLKKDLEKFATKYLGPNPDPKSVGRLVDELAPNLSDFWSAVGPEGEQLALNDFDETREEAWRKTLGRYAKAAFQKAIDRLPKDAHRLRAQYTPDQKDDEAKTKKGGKS